MNIWMWLLIGFLTGLVVAAILSLLFRGGSSKEAERAQSNAEAKLAKSEVKITVLEDKLRLAEADKLALKAKLEEENSEQLAAAEAEYKANLAVVESEKLALAASLAEVRQQLKTTQENVGVKVEEIEPDSAALLNRDEDNFLGEDIITTTLVAEEINGLTGTSETERDDIEIVLDDPETESVEKTDEDPNLAESAAVSLSQLQEADEIDEIADSIDQNREIDIESLEDVDIDLELVPVAVNELGDDKGNREDKLGIAAVAATTAAATIEHEGDEIPLVEEEMETQELPGEIGIKEIESDFEIQNPDNETEDQGSADFDIEGQHSAGDGPIMDAATTATAAAVIESFVGDEAVDREPSPIDSAQLDDDSSTPVVKSIEELKDDSFEIDSNQLENALVETEEAEKAAAAASEWPEDNSVWKGEYFNNMKLDGEPALIRNDEVVNFNWEYGSPSPEINVDNFSVRWTRTANLPPGLYRFTVTSDDGARLWVNERLVISAWYDHKQMTFRREMEISGGPVNLRLEYYENDMTALIQCSWERIG